MIGPDYVVPNQDPDSPPNGRDKNDEIEKHLNAMIEASHRMLSGTVTHLTWPQAVESDFLCRHLNEIARRWQQLKTGR
ncbi:hypothetical protein [Labrys sp. (in: a-proteobacteria)]|uniref:hypothetical protein n=1 Tax=Labrys sp. (in: a-proteobacteria) TaxID=1917972 RepID=UPI0039E61DE2